MNIFDKIVVNKTIFWFNFVIKNILLRVFFVLNIYLLNITWISIY